MYWFIASLILIAILIWKGYFQPYSYWKNMGVPQTSPWFMAGDTWPTLLRVKNVKEWIDWIYWMHPGSKYTGIYQFYTPSLMVKDPDLIRRFTIKDFDYFTDHESFTADEKVDPLWSRNLFALKGQRWREMRSLLSGSFTSSKMRMMYGLIVEESEKFATHFKNKNTSSLDLDMKDAFSKYTADVIASTSFGIKLDSLGNPDNEFYKMGKEVSDFTSFKVLLKFIGLIVCPWLLKMFNIGFVSNRVRYFFTNIIEETVKIREENEVVRPDMINILVEAKRGFSKADEEDVPDKGFAVVKETLDSIVKTQKKRIEITNLDIAAQSTIFFLAGFDTVSWAMSYTSYELALNPEVQHKLREEINKIFEKTNGKPSYEDLLGMRYMDMVVSESLRKWPIAPIIDRLCVKPYTLEPENPEEPRVTFKEKDVLWIPVTSIHHDEKYYPNPDKFIPERFSEENRENIKPYTYMPFGVGPRACIGSRFALLEIKAVLFHVLKDFELVPSKKTQIPLVFSKKSVTLTPEKGIYLEIRSLKK